MEMRWALLGGLLLTAAATWAQAPPPRPQSLDPLTPREQDLAAKTALGDPGVRELAKSGSPRVEAVLFLAPNKPEPGRDNPEKSQDLGRFALVLLYVRESNTGLQVLVDLGRQSVVETKRIDPRGVPLGQEDLEEAWALARQDKEVLQLLGNDLPRFRPLRMGEPQNAVDFEVQALGYSGPSGDPCSRDRCLALLFRRGDAYVEWTDVVVNLTQQKVLVRRNAPERRKP